MQMLANFSLSSVSPLSLQPRWLTLGERGLLGNASGRAFLSGCSPSLCYHSSPTISRQHYCSCHCLLPLLTLSAAKWGCTETVRADFSLKHLLLLFLRGSLLSFSISYLQSCPLLNAAMLSPLGSRPPLHYKETHREHARWELRGSELCHTRRALTSSPGTYLSGT